MVRIYLAMIAAIIMTACSSKEYIPQYITVDVPVIVYRDRKVPDSLLSRIETSSIDFVEISGMSCLDENNAALLRYDLERVAGKLRAWRAFSIPAVGVE